MAEFKIEIKQSDVEHVLKSAMLSSRNNNPVEAAVILIAATEVVLRIFEGADRESIEATIRQYAAPLPDLIQAELAKFAPGEWFPPATNRPM